MSNLKDSERLDLEKMVKEYDAVDNTNRIRELKHSGKIKENVERLVNLKKIHFAGFEFSHRFHKIIMDVALVD